MQRARSSTISLALVAATVAGCAAQPTTTPTTAVTARTASPSSTTAPTSTPPPAVGNGDGLVLGMFVPPSVPALFGVMSNAFEFRPPSRADVIIQLVYNGLYRYNESLEAVPDLAAEPCAIASDQVTITCRLVETAFHDGTPLTADDVVFTYELVNR